MLWGGRCPDQFQATLRQICFKGQYADNLLIETAIMSLGAFEQELMHVFPYVPDG